MHNNNKHTISEFACMFTEPKKAIMYYVCTFNHYVDPGSTNHIAPD